MEWLTNLLGFANQGSSPFGAMGGGAQPQSGTAGRPFGFPPSLPGVTGTQPPPAAAPPPMPSNGPLPFMGPNGQPSAAPGAPPPAAPAQPPGLWNQQQQGNGNQLMSQAMNMLKPPQMQPAQWMPWMK